MNIPWIPGPWFQRVPKKGANLPSLSSLTWHPLENLLVDGMDTGFSLLLTSPRIGLVLIFTAILVSVGVSLAANDWEKVEGGGGDSTNLSPIWFVPSCGGFIQGGPLRSLQMELWAPYKWACAWVTRVITPCITIVRTHHSYMCWGMFFYDFPLGQYVSTWLIADLWTNTCECCVFWCFTDN